MSALRQPLKHPAYWIKIIAAVALAAAAIFDWTRPPQDQVSVRVYSAAIVRPYQKFVSPHTSGFIHCRFKPTCSHYSFRAVHTHGFTKGMWLTLKRLVRCAPWTPPGTLDPVPPRKN